MYRFCERCERETFDGNLWCQDPDCPAEQGYPLLGYGDTLGDLKVTKFVRAWRTAALYEAERDGDPVFLKVAHAGEDHADRLRREANVLASIAPRSTGMGATIRSFLPSSRPLYLVPLPPYPGRTKRTYGEITFQGEARVFSVYKYTEGKILSDLLLETPQVWHTHAAWLISTVAKALRPLAKNRRCHLSLTPDIILVDKDRDGILRPTLLDLGFLITGEEADGRFDWTHLCEPAYSAPEILSHSPDAGPTPAADVYSLGMIFYEMLAGKPGFEHRLRRDEQLRDVVLQIRNPLPVGRPELEQSGVVGVLEKAVSPSGRYGNVLDFSKDLGKIYSSPPAERRKVPRRMYVLLGVLGVILLAVGVFAALTLLQILSGTP
jgi:serine/threonine protein kinase